MTGVQTGALPISLFLFFFKQKTAYEIKECDWSSDVCSSDLVLSAGQGASEVFSQMIDPGTSVTIPVPVSGAGTLKAYVDGSLLEEKDVP